jgi:arginyl-tRNA synthetase
VISADVRRAAWDAAQAAVAAGELPGPIPAGGGAADTSTLRPGRPGQYVSTLPYLLASAATPPRQVANILAARLASLPWIAAASAAAGHLTVTVTVDALAAVAIRTAQAPDCARSDILRGMKVPAPPPADLAAATSWQQAHAELAAEVTARLAAKAGAEIAPERLPPGRSRGSADAEILPERLPPGRFRGSADAEILPERVPPGRSHGSANAGTDPERLPPGRSRGSADAGPVAAAIGYAGCDVVRYALVRRARGWRDGARVEVPARYHLDNPAYAVRYAHAHAASTLRQAADLGLGAGPAAEFAPWVLTQPAERVLLGALSWLPERVAWAARSRRPGEFARYTEELAGAYLDCRETCPAVPFGGRGAPRDEPETRARLWLVTAAAAAIAAGLELLGVSAPDRL